MPLAQWTGRYHQKPRADSIENQWLCRNYLIRNGCNSSQHLACCSRSCFRIYITPQLPSACHVIFSFREEQKPAPKPMVSPSHTWPLLRTLAKSSRPKTILISLTPLRRFPFPSYDPVYQSSASIPAAPVLSTVSSCARMASIIDRACNIPMSPQIVWMIPNAHSQ